MTASGIDDYKRQTAVTKVMVIKVMVINAMAINRLTKYPTTTHCLVASVRSWR